MGLLGLYLPFLSLCKSQGIWGGTRTWGVKDFHKCWLGSLAKTLPWARRCNKLHSTICIVLLSEFVSQNARLQQSSELNSPILVQFSPLILKTSVFTLAILFDHFQFTLIHGHNIPGSYTMLFFIAPNFTSVISLIHSWLFFFGSVSSFFLELFLH